MPFSKGAFTKKISFTPPSINSVSDEDEDDYLRDPEQMWDSLPQPYRMVNKQVMKVFDFAWEIIEKKENKRLAQERLLKPPEFFPSTVEIYGDATALASSPDGRHVFMGLNGGLSALDATTYVVLSDWIEEGVEVVTIRTFTFTADAVMLLTIDDMAVARIFFFVNDGLYLVKAFQGTEGSKLLAHDCHASSTGDYIGIVFENPSTKDVWLEVSKAPREAWVPELEAIEPKPAIQKKSEMQEEKEEVTTSERGLEVSSGSAGHRQDAPSTPPLQVSIEKPIIKFTSIAPSLKLKPLSHFTANPCPSIQSACQKVDATGAAPSTGHTHILSSGHLQARDEAFQLLHPDLVQYLTEETRESEDIMMATFHFLHPGRSSLYMSKEEPDLPTSMVVWWKDGNQLLQYSLVKGGGKDISDQKPETVWPFSCPISCSAVSDCTSHVAVGLQNGNVCIWDRYLGLQRGVINLSEHSSPKMLRFLPTSLYPTAPLGYPPYPQRRSTYLLAQCQDSTQYLYDISQSTHEQPLCIGDLPEDDDEEQTLLESIPEMPQLCLAVQKNGDLFLKDVLTGVDVCQLVCDNYDLYSPWEPIVCLGNRGQSLFVKGVRDSSINQEDSEATHINITRVFVFPLNAFCTLECFRTRDPSPAPLSAYPNLQERLNALMKDRLEQQVLRKQRLQSRWGLLKADLAVIQGARETDIQFTARPYTIHL